MKIILAIASGLVLLGVGCESNALESYTWNAYDRVTATVTSVTFDHPSGYAIKEAGSEKIIVGGLLGRIEIYNQDFYNIDNNDLNPARPNETFKKGNFYAYLFHNKTDKPTKDELLKIVSSIKIK